MRHEPVPAECAHVSWRGALGALHCADLKRVVKNELAAGAPRIVVDLHGVTELDAVAIGALLDLASTCASAGVALELVPPRSAAADALVLLGAGGRLSFVTAA